MNLNIKLEKPFMIRFQYNQMTNKVDRKVINKINTEIKN